MWCWRNKPVKQILCTYNMQISCYFARDIFVKFYLVICFITLCEHVSIVHVCRCHTLRYTWTRFETCLMVSWNVFFLISKNFCVLRSFLLFVDWNVCTMLLAVHGFYFYEPETFQGRELNLYSVVDRMHN